MNVNFTSIDAGQYLDRSKTGKVLHLIFDATTNELVNYKFYQKTKVAEGRTYLTVEDAFYTIDTITYNGIATFATVTDNATRETIASRYIMDSDKKKIVIGIGAKSVPETYNDIFMYSEKIMKACMNELCIVDPNIVRVDLAPNSSSPEILQIVNNNTLESFKRLRWDQNGLHVNNIDYLIKGIDKHGKSLVCDMHQTESITISSNAQYNEWIYTNATVELFQYLISRIYNKAALIEKYKDLAVVTKENLFEYYIKPDME